MKRMAMVMCAAAACGLWATTAARPEDREPFKLAVIDPLSGGAAALGSRALKTWEYLRDEVNAKGGINGAPLQIMPYDNKANPAESLVAAQNAIDHGARFLTQAAGSAVGGALVEFVRNYNDRHPGQEVLYLNFGAVDPALTNEKCAWGHFRFDATTDMKTAAFSDFIKTRSKIKKVYLINQDYSFGQAVRKKMREMLTTKRPDIEIVGDELHPLLKVTDFSPYVAKIRASGADSVITANWAQDFALLLKAAAESGLDVDWYAYYGYLPGGPTAIKQTGHADRVFSIVGTGVKDLPAESLKFETAFRDKYRFGFFAPLVNELRMLQEAARQAKSNEPMAIAAKLENMTVPAIQGGTIHMRRDDHEASQDLFISRFGPFEPGRSFDEEETGWGWTALQRIAGDSTILPTRCKMERPAAAEKQ